MKYDFAVIGSGLFGSVFAYEATKRNKKVLVIEKRNHIGGNCYTESIDNINVHIQIHLFFQYKYRYWQYQQ